MSSLSIPTDYAWVLLAAVCATGPLNVYQILNVSSARKASGIKYPQLYPTPEQAAADPKAHIFGCVQRAHQNTLEAITGVLFSLLFSGLFHPRAAAALGFTWVFGRVLYTIGYSTGHPAKRNWGAMGSIASIGLMGLSLYSGVTMVLATL